MVIELELDRDAALHLIVALERHKLFCAEQERYLPLPLAIRELARLARDVKAGRTEPDIPRADRDTGTDDQAPEPRPFYSQREAAAEIGRHERTIRRWIKEGKLTASVAGIPLEELDRLKGRQSYART